MARFSTKGSLRLRAALARAFEYAARAGCGAIATVMVLVDRASLLAADVFAPVKDSSPPATGSGVRKAQEEAPRQPGGRDANGLATGSRGGGDLVAQWPLEPLGDTRSN